jgi:Xaa-Pro aminopeptidase
VPDHDARLDAFRERLAGAGLSAAFLPESADVEYLTGVPRARNVADPAWDAEVLVEGCFIGLEAGPLFLLTHSEWSLPAELALRRFEVRHMPAEEDPRDWLRDAARSVDAGDRIGVGDHTPFRQAELLREALPGTALVPASEHVLALRGQKDDEEIALIRAAGTLALEALDATLPRFGTRFRRSDFLRELEHQMSVRGSERVAYAPDIFAVGPEVRIGWSADVVADGDAEVVAPAAVSVDWGAVLDGYRSDLGRTFYVGEPPPGQREALDVVRTAQDAAVAAVRPGVPAEQVDRTARDILESAGLGDAFWIPAGHGIGLEIHEPPRLRAGVRDPLPERAVVTVEIAAWRDGELSAFWEDEVLALPGGGERLTSGPDEPFVVA